VLNIEIYSIISNKDLYVFPIDPFDGFSSNNFRYKKITQKCAEDQFKQLL